VVEVEELLMVPSLTRLVDLVVVVQVEVNVDQEEQVTHLQ
jgi:hypothetical protein